MYSVIVYDVSYTHFNPFKIRYIELHFIIHKGIGLLRAENHNQNMEIASLKNENVYLLNNTTHQHETLIKDLVISNHERMDDIIYKSAGTRRRSNLTCPTSPKPHILFPDRINETNKQ